LSLFFVPLQKTIMRAIQFNKNNIAEQCHTPVSTLATVELEIKEEFPAEIIKGIEQGWQELRQGKGISNEEVHKKARLLCAKNIRLSNIYRQNRNRFLF